MKQLTPGFISAARIALAELVLTLEDEDVDILGVDRVECHEVACDRLIEELEYIGENVDEWKDRFQAVKQEEIEDDE